MGAELKAGSERSYKLVMEYDGTGLAGWQRQKDQPSIQGYIELAFSRLTNEKATVIGAGRTDAGVHARGQVAHFKTRSRLGRRELLRGANALLPRQIAVLSLEEAPPDFHARYQARSKIYDYDLYIAPVRSTLNRLYSWHIPSGLDLGAMSQALESLRGEHDFTSFQSTGSSTGSAKRRIFTAGLSSRPDGLVRITLEGDGFLRHMVRAIVGTLVEVGRGQVSPEGFERILKAKDRSLAGMTAPAHGLCLREVKY
ncbi:MAG: tRNA pseudouridine(38-40) synthase TruA [Deltaproteobacteria bacterium]|nr:tRNA pseudouridine(38-40) synthase TruA [Deltaproteobacteria bacterium]MBW2086816.1 tRNA pseudouridine(38-40) synthase TruA [Deltaproteobacteria bacterium]